MYERDRQTDGQTHSLHDGIGRACIASRGKKSDLTMSICLHRVPARDRQTDGQTDRRTDGRTGPPMHS